MQHKSVIPRGLWDMAGLWALLWLLGPGNSFAGQPTEPLPTEANNGGAEFGAYQTGQTGKAVSPTTNRVNRSRLSLAGTWTVTLDADDAGLKEGWLERNLTGQAISLPGTLDDAGIGEPEAATNMVLTRRKAYIGPAWYQREVVIPESWRGKLASLFLERVMWESRVWVDGRLIGSQDSLVTPQVHELGDRLPPGRHRLTVRVDNRERPGANSHSYGNNIQIRWNGLVGRLELSARDALSLSSLQAYPEPGQHRVLTTVSVVNDTGVTVAGQVTFQVIPHGQAKAAPAAEVTADFQGAGQAIRVERYLDLGAAMKTWDEFEPALYDLVATVRGGAGEAALADECQVTFGMRELGVRGTQFTLNGRTLFLRGTHDAGSLPLTGRPPMTVAEWRRIFLICKAHGLNHVRYHSFCPPEEAFTAADETGVMLQVELPYWGQVKEDWAGTPFLRQEMDRILADYGNHPSFLLMSMGNEHSGDWDTLAGFVAHGKRADPRHRYASASNAYKHSGLSWVPGDEFSTVMWDANTNGQRQVLRYMERFQNEDEPVARDQDWRRMIGNYPDPVISHELGQWWTYPDFGEIAKYIGVLRPTTLEAQRAMAEKGGTLILNQAFHRASGALSVELYKEEIERQLRTPGLAGFQLLDLHDYSGQGSALVGMLDAFWDSKGMITPADFRRFCAPTVVLARIPQTEYVFGDTLKVSLEVAHYAAAPLVKAEPVWRLLCDDGSVMAAGRLPAREIPTGGNTQLGVVAVPLVGTRAQRLTLEAEIPGTGQGNCWHVWVYPRQSVPTPAIEQVRVTRKLDDATLAYVEHGGRLLLVADHSDQTTPVYFSSPAWVPLYGIDTCGALIDDRHPALADFPTEFHSDWQWFDLLHRARGLVINDDLPSPIPIVQAIDSPCWRGAPILLVGAGAVGKGTVAVTSLDLIDNLDTQPSVRQLRQSLLEWLANSTNPPAVVWSGSQLKRLLDGGRFHVVAGLPAGAKPVLEVNCAGRALTEGTQPWQASCDALPVAAPGFNYSLAARARTWKPAPVVWRKGAQHGWNLPTIQISLTVPKNFAGTLYLYFQDTSPAGKRDGIVYAAGGTLMVGRHDGAGRWLALDMGAKDTAQGRFDVLVHPRSFSEAPMLRRLVLCAGEHNLEPSAGEGQRHK